MKNSNGLVCQCGAKDGKYANVFGCDRCGEAVCFNCARSLEDDTALCPNCAAEHRPTALERREENGK